MPKSETADGVGEGEQLGESGLEPKMRADIVMGEGAAGPEIKEMRTDREFRARRGRMDTVAFIRLWRMGHGTLPAIDQIVANGYTPEEAQRAMEVVCADDERATATLTAISEDRGGPEDRHAVLTLTGLMRRQMDLLMEMSGHTASAAMARWFADLAAFEQPFRED